MTTFKCTHIHPILAPAHFQYLQFQWNDISHLNFRLFNSTVVEIGPILSGVGWERVVVSGATRCSLRLLTWIRVFCIFHNFHFGRDFCCSFEKKEEKLFTMDGGSFLIQKFILQIFAVLNGPFYHNFVCGTIRLFL